MIRWTMLVATLLAVACGPSPTPVEPTDDVTPTEEPSGETPTADTEPDDATAAAGGTEGAGLGEDLVGHCRELVGSGRPDTCVIDALIENASCAELPELVDCLSSVGSAADQQERARVLEESCG